MSKNISIKKLEKLLSILNKHGVRSFKYNELSLEIVPTPTTTNQQIPSLPMPEYKEPEMPMSMAVWGAKYNG